MACHLLSGSECLQQYVPSTLSCLTYSDVSLLCDTTEVYIQGRIKQRWQFCEAAKRKFLKVLLEEEGSGDSIMLYLVDDYGEQCREIEIGDVVVVTAFKIELGGSGVCQLIVGPPKLQPSDLVPKVWVKISRRGTVVQTDISSSASCESVGSNSTSNDASEISDVAMSSRTSSASNLTDAAANKNVNCKSAVKNNTSANLSKLKPKSAVGKAGDAGSSRNAKSPAKPYQYVVISDLKAGTSVNIFGVVKFSRAITKSRGTDFWTMISIVDSSLASQNTKLKCMLFAKESKLLPDVSVGDIIRLHRLRITSFDNELQGQSGPGFAWIIFEPTSDLIVKAASSTSYTFTDDDEQKVKELIDWSTSDSSLLSQIDHQNQTATGPDGLITLSSVSLNKYFDLICQVVATCVIVENQSKLLRVWDGTQANGHLFEQDTTKDDLSARFVVDNNIANNASGYMVDIWVYDDHFIKTKDIKPGDYIQLTNVHAMPHRYTEDDLDTDRAVTMTELCVHGAGQKYNRDVRILDPDSSEAKRLKLVLAECVEFEKSSNLQDAQMDFDFESDGDEIFISATSNVAAETSSRVVQQESDSDLTALTTRKRAAEDMICSDDETDRGGNREKVVVHGDDLICRASGADSSDDRCLLRTATVIKGHHHIPVSCLHDVIIHGTPSKFKISAVVVDYSPKSSTPSDIMRLFCVDCNFVCSVPNELSSCDSNDLPGHASQLSMMPHHKEQGVDIYPCPSCSRRAVEGSNDDRVVFLSYIYMMNFVLDDGTGWLSAILCRDEAVQFFHGVKPIDVLRSKTEYETIRNQLDEMCSSDKQQSRKVECCLLSYSTPCGRSYQIFDTELSLDN